ncbi:MAG: GNAT family N-acetyltransferase [Rhodothermales bacterium]
MSIEIQLLTTDNTALLSNLAPEVFDQEINPQYLQAFLADDRHIMFVAIDNKSANDITVVGMASAVEYFHPDKPAQLWINEVGVATTHRRRGIGRKLIKALITVAEERGCVYTWLGTDTDNTPAQACFASIPDGEAPQKFLLYEWELKE